jgi:L-amino acid N-acyltransferase YncA
VANQHSSIEVRPIEPADKPELAAAFSRLSPESRYRRFLSPNASLAEADLRYLTEVDHVDHEALVAVDPGGGQGIGVARYVRLADRPETAELGVVVSDDRQGEGVGSLLLQRLAARARENGIHRFSALILEENQAMLSLIRELGDVQVGERDSGAVQVEVKLPDEGLGAALRGMLRAAARGELVARPMRLARRLGAPE